MKISNGCAYPPFSRLRRPAGAAQAGGRDIAQRVAASERSKAGSFWVMRNHAYTAANMVKRATTVWQDAGAHGRQAARRADDGRGARAREGGGRGAPSARGLQAAHGTFRIHRTDSNPQNTYERQACEQDRTGMKRYRTHPVVRAPLRRRELRVPAAARQRRGVSSLNWNHKQS
jgi:hypothetical protein